MRDAFAAGYAETGIYPIPAWVRGACEAAISIDAPREFVTEAGRVEGRRTALIRRRQRLYDSHRERVMACVAQLAANVHLDDLVFTLASAAPTTEATAAQKRRDAIKAAALAYLLRTILTTDGLSAAWQQANADAVVEARAEGIAEASAAPDGGPATLAAVEREFPAAASGLAGAQAWKTADQWTDQQVSGLAGDLAKAVGAETDAAKLLAPVAGALRDSVGVAYYLEESMHAEYTLGFAVYASSQQANINFMTVGDAKVDGICIGYAQSSPYTADDFPQPPVHGDCRCWPEIDSPANVLVAA